DATETLWLGRFADSDITYKWNATLKADCGTFPAEQQGEDSPNRILIAFHNDDDPTADYALSFEVIGGEISFTDVNDVRADEKDDENEVMVIFAGDSPKVHIIVNGGKMGTDMQNACVISAQEDGKGATVTLEKGELNAPHSAAVLTDEGKFFLNKTALQNDTLKINGLVDPTGVIDGIVSVFAYGTSTLDLAANTGPFELASFHITVTENASCTLELPIDFGQKTAMTVENNATATINGVQITLSDEDSLLHVKKGGTLKLINGGKITNNGIINNEAAGEIINEGTIENAGTINNDGTINTSKGTINNKGTIKSNADKIIGAGNITGNPPVSDQKPSSGGGGCNTGYGLFGLLLAGILTFKYRKA
ncbi:MAG: hypothetical protein LBS53_07380, partial [Synergistaceae bacterium]|nr:hypothetical protein [Synergistaceae bacterium]